MRPDALYQGSPAYNWIALLAVRTDDADRSHATDLSDTSVSVMPIEQTGPSRQQPYRFGGASGLTVRCAPRLGEDTVPSHRWSDCSALLAVNESTRLWVQFDAAGRPPASFPRAVGAARDFMAATQH